MVDDLVEPRRPPSERLEVAGPRPEAGRHHPRRRRSCSSRRSRVLGIERDDGLRLRPARGRAARRAAPPPRHRRSGTSATSATRASCTWPSLTPGEKAPQRAGRRARPPALRGHPRPARARRDYEELLEAAGLLCNVGLAISHDRHHLHSYYVIRNTDLLAGLHRPRDRAHRPRRPLPPQVGAEVAATRSSPASSSDDQRVVRVLAGLLRVAVGLDRTRDGVVRGVRVEPTGKRALRVVVDSRRRDAELELYSAEARKDLLEDALDVPIEIELAGDAGGAPCAARPSRRPTTAWRSTGRWLEVGRDVRRGGRRRPAARPTPRWSAPRAATTSSASTPGPTRC